MLLLKSNIYKLGRQQKIMEISDLFNDLAIFTMNNNLAAVKGLIGGILGGMILPEERPKEAPFVIGGIVALAMDIMEYSREGHCSWDNDIGYMIGVAAGIKIEELARKYFKSYKNKLPPRGP